MSNNTLWLVAAILAPLFWAATNVLDSAVRRNYIKNDLTITWLGGLMDLPMVILFFYLGGFVIPNPIAFIGIFAAGVLWILPITLYFKALKNEEASRVALLLQLIPIWTLLMGYLILGERLGSVQFIAFFFIVVGGAFAAVKKINGRWNMSKALVLIGSASFLWGLSDVLFKKYEAFFPSFESAFAIYFFSGFVTAFGMFVYSMCKKKTKHHLKSIPRRGWVMLVISVVTADLALISFSYALTLKEASLTSVVIGIQPLFVIILTYILSRFVKEIKKEALGKSALIIKMGAFSLIMIGLYLIQLN